MPNNLDSCYWCPDELVNQIRYFEINLFELVSLIVANRAVKIVCYLLVNLSL